MKKWFSLALVIFALSSAAKAVCIDKNIVMSKVDGKACGLFGCSKNKDGTFSPNKAACACEPGGCEVSVEAEADLLPLDPQGECSDQSTRLRYLDAKACGMLGCSKNVDGTFSPKIFRGSCVSGQVSKSQKSTTTQKVRSAR